MKDVHDYEQQLFELLNNKYGDLMTRFEQGYFDDSDVETLKSALNEMQR